jgi:AcrR family transcriptional regulator
MGIGGVVTATKGDRTRQRIVERAAPVFNTRGYAGTSMRELVDATGLERGGIYNHFASKEELALASLDHAVALIEARFAEAQAGCTNAVDRLRAIVDAFVDANVAPVVEGGCPIVNTAIEADDTNPLLAARARDAMASWHRLVGSIVKSGKRDGELRADVDPYELATVLTATLEGALVLARLDGDRAHLERASRHLVAHVESLRAGSVGRSARADRKGGRR